MKSVRLQLVKHMVAATVFLGVCNMVIQISVLIIDLPLEKSGLMEGAHVKYLYWFAATRTLVALALAFYLSRKALSSFDRFLDKRRLKSPIHQPAQSTEHSSPPLS